jgi:ATP-binding cassette, subfamily B, bacterial PglK
MNKTISKFLYVIGDKKSQLVPLVTLFVVSSLIDALGIGLIGPFIGLAANPGYVRQNAWLQWSFALSGLEVNTFIALLGGIIIAIFYAKSLIYFYIQRYILKFANEHQIDLRRRLLHAYLNVPYTFHLKRNSAVLIRNILMETLKFTQGIMIPLLTSAANLVVLVVLLFLLIKTDLSATIIILIILLLAFLPYFKFRKKVSHWGEVNSKSQAEMIRVANHSLGGLKEIRVIGCESYFENKMLEQSKLSASVSTSYGLFQALPRISTEALLITFLVGLASLSLLTNNTQNLVSILGVFAVASIRLLPSIIQLVSNISTIKNNSYSLDRIYFDIKELKTLDSANQQQTLAQGPHIVDLPAESLVGRTLDFEQEIILDNVSYRYPETSESAIKNLSLSIKKGASIALIGKSGAGKTTIVDIILGLLEPQGGSITVDGVSIYDNLRLWQNLVGYIPQAIFLADDTIERNIAFGVPDRLINPERLEKSIRMAQLAELVEELPDGIKTLIGERGVRLSGGQRQRLGIARALYHEREILVLDEATAALDSETESLVSDAIRALGGTKTIIIIAHRLSTVEHCNFVYMIEKGKIVKSGTYREVVLSE